MKSGSRQSTRVMADAGLNSSDLAAGDVESLRSTSKKYPSPLLLTPLASFSAEDLATLRRSSPDAYQALLQYEQLCRHNTAVIEAKETELRRCIDVGQEVLAKMDQLQLRCSQLAKERDDALETVKQIQRQTHRQEAKTPRGEGKEVLTLMQRENQQLHNTERNLREQLKQRETELSNLQASNETLKTELREQKQLHDALKQDLQEAVIVARRAGASTDIAEKARQVAEASLIDLRRQLEEKEQELTQLHATKHECEETLRQLQQQQQEWVTTSMRQSETLQQPSVQLLGAAAQLVAMHNQMLDIIIMLSGRISRKSHLSPSTFSPPTRLRIPTKLNSENSVNNSGKIEEMEDWLLQSLEETSRLVPEMSRLFQQMEDRLRCSEADQERLKSERQLALDEAQDLGFENEHLRQSLLALKEEVQSLDAQTDQLREIESLETRRQTLQRVATLGEEKLIEQETLQRELEQARRQGALELSQLHKHLEEERDLVEREIRSLQAELNRWRAEEKAAAIAAAAATAAATATGRLSSSVSSPPDDIQLKMEQRQRTLQGMVEELETENQRLRSRTSQNIAELKEEISRLEQALQDGKTRYHRQMQQHEEEMEKVRQNQREELQRLRNAETIVLRRAEGLQQEIERMNVIVQELREKLQFSEETSDQLQRRLKDELRETCDELERVRTQVQEEVEKQQRQERIHREEVHQLTTENTQLQEQLKSFSPVKESDLLNEQHMKEMEAKETTIASLNRQLREAEIGAAKLQDALHRSSQKAKEAIDTSVPVDRYEELETELMQEKENAESLANSLATAETEMQNLLTRLNEQQKRVRDCLRIMPPSPARRFLKAASTLQAAAKKSATRLLSVLEEEEQQQPPLLFPSPGSTRENEDLTVRLLPREVESPAASNLQPSGLSPNPVTPLVPIHTPKKSSPLQHLQHQQQEQNAGRSVSRTLSPPTSPVLDDLSPPSIQGMWQDKEQAVAAFSSAFERFITDLTTSMDQVLLQPYANFFESLHQLHDLFFEPLKEIEATFESEGSKENRYYSENGNGKSNTGIKDGGSTSVIESEVERCDSVSVDALWCVVSGGIIDAYVDTCAAVFQRVRRSAASCQREEELLRCGQRTRAGSSARLRRSAGEASSVQREREAQLATATVRLAAAQETAREAEARADEATARCHELASRVEHLEHRLAAGQREWEAERLQWRNTVGELQSERETRRRERLEQQQQQHHQEIERLEQELREARASQSKASQALHEIREKLEASNLLIQERQNEEAARARKAERTIEALQEQLRNAQVTHQTLQKSLLTEERRSAAADERSDIVTQQLEDCHRHTRELEERITELQEAWLLQQRTLDVELKKTEALQKVNRLLEERLADVEGDREPLRQQLQGLLLLQPCGNDYHLTSAKEIARERVREGESD
ncbi:hypothetical protein LSM04_009594 [Trypanosoma melophagium]|uniref:uncharacterized protein n=1 Tax=Trypanosoma melophagium TaxID=715481 RepID=UPI00351A615E|nr:hypothetical protein LSM04_009594 [Trypanosoma melophagium]